MSRRRLPVASLHAAHGRRGRRPKRSGLRRLGAAVAAVALAAAVLAGIGYTGAAVLRSSCSLASERPIELGRNSFVYAASGAPLGMVPAVRRRDPVGLAQMSPWLPRATV